MRSTYEEDDPVSMWPTATRPQWLSPCGYAVMPELCTVGLAADRQMHRGRWRG